MSYLLRSAILLLLVLPGLARAETLREAADVCRAVVAKYTNPTGQSSSAWEWSAEECAAAVIALAAPRGR